MLRLLFCFLIVLVANPAHGQGVNIDNLLNSNGPGGQHAVSDDFLNEGGGSGFNADSFLNEEGGPEFNPMDELDTIPRIRKEKEIADKENEIAAAKDYDARMEQACWCVFHPCLVLEAKLKDDLSAAAKRQAERRADAYNDRAKAKEAACRRWKEGGITAETLSRQLEALKAQRDDERVIEERLKRQRLADERRNREAGQAQSRQRAAAAQAEREAEQLAWCQKAWGQGRAPCECEPLPGAPARVREARTCEK